MNEFKKTGETESSAVNKRRSFLKKAASGAVITTLPAKSVWGACSVSGAMSGNLSQNTDRHDCDLPNLPPGRSPGFWSDIATGVHGAFNKLQNVHDPKRTCYIQEITAFVNSTSMELEPSIITESDNLAVALGSNGGGDADANLFFHLAAVYLNSYYGFYGLGVAGSKAAASELVNAILMHVYTETMQGNPPVLSDAYWNMSMYDPTTNFEVTTETNCVI